MNFEQERKFIEEAIRPASLQGVSLFHVPEGYSLVEFDYHAAAPWLFAHIVPLPRWLEVYTDSADFYTAITGCQDRVLAKRVLYFVIYTANPTTQLKRVGLEQYNPLTSQELEAVMQFKTDLKAKRRTFLLQRPLPPSTSPNSVFASVQIDFEDLMKMVVITLRYRLPQVRIVGIVHDALYLLVPQSLLDNVREVVGLKDPWIRKRCPWLRAPIKVREFFF